MIYIKIKYYTNFYFITGMLVRSLHCIYQQRVRYIYKMHIYTYYVTDLKCIYRHVLWCIEYDTMNMIFICTLKQALHVQVIFK